MGSVWAAVHEVLGREVAIKFLRSSFEDPSTAAARFAAEAKAVALVKNRFVVDVFDFGFTEGGDPYMVQELLTGRPLSDLLTEGPAWSVRDAARFMMDCLSGLAAVHARGIIHRDLKPENIFVVPEPEGNVPKLLDFGISKSEEARPTAIKRPSLREPGKGRLTALGATLGTPAYMSPEQLRNLSTLDARADLYSLGVVFYEWLAGNCPYASNPNFAELVQQIEARSMVLLEELRPDVGPELCAVVTTALDPDRERRYGSALEMRAALAETLALMPDAMTHVQHAKQPPARLPPAFVPQRSARSNILPPVAPSLQGRMPMAIAPAPKSMAPLPMSSQPSSSAPLSLAPLSLAPLSLAPPSLAPLSLMPDGLSSGPTWKFWSALAVVGGLALGTVIALRSVSHHTAPRAQAAPKPAPVVAPAPAQIIVPAVEPALPYGSLPPEAAPDQELSAPQLAEEAPRERRHANKSAHVAHERAQPEERTAKPVQREVKPVPEPKPAPKSDPKSDEKLLRSLDF